MFVDWRTFPFATRSVKHVIISVTTLSIHAPVKPHQSQKKNKQQQQQQQQREQRDTLYKAAKNEKVSQD